MFVLINEMVPIESHVANIGFVVVVEEEEEVLIQELIGLTPEVLKNLADNGFETIAELSVAPLDELMTMEGVDEEIGKSILEQVKQRLENTENV